MESGIWSEDYNRAGYQAVTKGILAALLFGCPFAFDKFPHPAFELRAGHKYFVITPGAAYANVSAKSHDPPVIAATGVGLAQSIHISKLDV